MDSKPELGLLLTEGTGVTAQVVDKPQPFEGGIAAISNFGAHPQPVVPYVTGCFLASFCLLQASSSTCIWHGMSWYTVLKVLFSFPGQALAALMCTASSAASRAHRLPCPPASMAWQMAMARTPMGTPATAMPPTKTARHDPPFLTVGQGLAAG